MHRPSAEWDQGKPRIAIIGAGIAGLNAALTLRDAGLPCQVYEASERLGGRIHSDTHTWTPGLVSEWCGEFIERDHETLWGLIERFGLETIELGQHVAPQARSLLYYEQHFQRAEDLEAEVQALAPVLRQQLRDAGYPTTYEHATEAGRQLDGLSVYAWIEHFVAGGHASQLGRLLNSACRGFYGAETRLQSSLNLVYMFGPMMGEPGEHPRLFGGGPTQGSYRLARGNQQLIQSIANLLPPASLHLEYRLTALARDAADGITLTFATPEGTETVMCEHAILALPFSTLRHADYRQARFDERKRSAIEQLLYGTISKLTLEFDTPYWYQGISWPRENNGFFLTDLEIQTLWDGSLGQPGSGALLVDYTGGAQGAAYRPPAAYSTTAEADVIREYAQQCLQQLEEPFPGISAHYTGRATLSYPTGDPHLQGSYACWGVGQYTSFGGYEHVPQGPFHFAGEHCSVEWQGYMEGAAREGARAAREIICE
jgi:monoamine oxidase